MCCNILNPELPDLIKTNQSINQSIVQFKQAPNATECYNKAIYDAMIIYIHTISIVEMLSELVSVTTNIQRTKKRGIQKRLPTKIFHTRFKNVHAMKGEEIVQRITGLYM